MSYPSNKNHHFINSYSSVVDLPIQFQNKKLFQPRKQEIHKDGGGYCRLLDRKGREGKVRAAMWMWTHADAPSIAPAVRVQQDDRDRARLTCIRQITYVNVSLTQPDTKLSPALSLYRTFGIVYSQRWMPSHVRCSCCPACCCCCFCFSAHSLCVRCCRSALSKHSIY